MACHPDQPFTAAQEARILLLMGARRRLDADQSLRLECLKIAGALPLSGANPLVVAEALVEYVRHGLRATKPVGDK